MGLIMLSCVVYGLILENNSLLENHQAPGELPSNIGISRKKIVFECAQVTRTKGAFLVVSSAGM